MDLYGEHDEELDCKLEELLLMISRNVDVLEPKRVTFQEDASCSEIQVGVSKCQAKFEVRGTDFWTV